jgi:type III restriction enzyme
LNGLAAVAPLVAQVSQNATKRLAMNLLVRHPPFPSVGPVSHAIESGLVKTPRVVVRDDGKRSSDYKSRFYHIYMDPDVRTDLNRKAEAHTPLPDLVVNGYFFLGRDWLETAKKWREAGLKVPPVMITVANRTETAARVQYAFARGKIPIEELCVPEKILHIDSKVLAEAEARDEPIAIEHGADAEGEEDEDESLNGPRQRLSKKDRAELLRKTVDTIGRDGQPGEQIQEVISVGMLSEGWDARTVTHIMGLRAFTSQLLCEQVVGRGLRRTSYEVDETGLFQPEYVNIFGVPFTFLPHEGGVDTPPPPPPPPKTRIEALPERRTEYEITWPNVLRVDHEYRPRLTLDTLKTKPLLLDAYHTATLAELAPMIDGKLDLSRLTEIDLEQLGRRFRMQKIIFSTASNIYDQMQPTWKGNREYLLAQLIRLVERFVDGEISRSIPRRLIRTGCVGESSSR